MTDLSHSWIKGLDKFVDYMSKGNHSAVEVFFRTVDRMVGRTIMALNWKSL